MTTHVRIALPFPPSVNAAYANGGNKRGRHKTPVYIAWEQLAATAIKASHRLGMKSYHLAICLKRIDRRRRDLGNYEKVVSDLLVKTGVIADDCGCQRLTMTWDHGMKEECVVMLIPAEEGDGCMIKPEVLDAMVAAGCTAQQIAAAVKADQARSSGAERQARYRARKASQSDERDVTSVTVTDSLSPKERSPTPPKEITPFPVSEPIGSSTDHAREFAETFWPAYPLKRGKPEALKAFIAARKRAPLAAIMAGVHRYAAERKGQDASHTKHPQGWLNGDRWNDEPLPLPATRSGAPPGEPRTVPEFARQRLREMEILHDQPPSQENRRLDEGERSADPPGNGIARRFAIPANPFGSIR